MTGEGAQVPYLMHPGCVAASVCYQNVFTAQALSWHLPEQQREVQLRCNATQRSCLHACKLLLQSSNSR